MEDKITKKEIEYLVKYKNLTISDLIDVVIELNGIIGVGLITLGKNLNEYCRTKIDKKL